MKAITPVIALVMLMLITVGIVGISYTWFSGLFSSQTKKAVSIPPGGAFCLNGEIKAFVLNSGDSAIATSDIIVAQVDGVDVKGTPFFGDMSTGLVGWWKFDETSGGTASDSSGKGNNGVLNNGPQWVTGKYKNAVKFDGTDGQEVRANNVPVNLASGTYNTVRFWMFWDGTGSSLMPFGWGTSYDLWISGNYFGFNTGGGDVYGITGTVAKLANKWVHITAVFPNNYPTDEPALYINGEKQSISLLQGTRNTRSSTQTLLFSGWGSTTGYKFRGTIDEAAVYTKTIGDFNIQPGKSGLAVNYPGTTGKHNIRIGTSSNTAETIVECQ